MLLWAAGMMLMLAVVAARFFRPALAEAVTLAGLSEDTAGATLLSLANGIPHVAKMLSAPDTAPGGLLMESSVLVTAGHGAAATTPLAIAMPIAISVFTTNATLAAVAFVSAAAGRRRSHCRCGASVDPPHFVRDVAFYSAALLLTALVLSYGKVTIWPAVLLLALYLTYMFLFVSCKRRALSPQHSMNSALLVARCDSLTHLLLAPPVTWPPRSFAGSPVFTSPSESSSPSSPGSPWGLRQSGDAGAPLKATSADSGSNAPASLTLLTARMREGSAASQPTPRFGRAATAAAPANLAPLEGAPSLLNTAALQALADAQDAFSAALARESSAQTRGAAHDFDGAVGPSTQFLQDQTLLPQLVSSDTTHGGGATAHISQLRGSDNSCGSQVGGSTASECFSFAPPRSTAQIPAAAASAAALSPPTVSCMLGLGSGELPDVASPADPEQNLGTDSRWRRSSHRARPIAESAHPSHGTGTPALLPIFVPTEPSVFLHSSRHTRQPSSVASAGLSSVRFPSCHTPVDGPSWFDADLPSFHLDPPPEAEPHPADPPPPTSALAALAAAPRYAWSCIVPPLATIARCFMPQLHTAESDPLAPLFTALLPVTIPLFVLVTQKLAFYPRAPLSATTVLYGAGCSLFSSVLLYTVYPPAGTVDGDRRVCFAAITLCMSRLWMFLLAAETNHVFRALGRIHGRLLHESLEALSATPPVLGEIAPELSGIAAAAARHSAGVLSATVYQWVEVAPDFLAIVGIASAGQTASAVAGCFGTPIFMMTVGTGAMLLRRAVACWGVAEAWDASAVPWVALGFAAATAVRHAVLVPLLHRWRISWAAAAMMLVFYAVFEAVYIWACL